MTTINIDLQISFTRRAFGDRVRIDDGRVLVERRAGVGVLDITETLQDLASGGYDDADIDGECPQDVVDILRVREQGDDGSLEGEARAVEAELGIESGSLGWFVASQVYGDDAGDN